MKIKIPSTHIHNVFTDISDVLHSCSGSFVGIESHLFALPH